MPQAVQRPLVFEDDDQHNSHHQPTSFVEEIAVFLEDAWAFFLEQRRLFRGCWHWVIVCVPVALFAAGVLAALWEFIPFFNSGL
jgi:hypothetical protein